MGGGEKRKTLLRGRNLHRGREHELKTLFFILTWRKMSQERKKKEHRERNQVGRKRKRKRKRRKKKRKR